VASGADGDVGAAPTTGATAMTGRRLLASAGVALVAGLGAVAMVGAAVADAPDPVMVEIEVHYSRFDPSVVEVPAGRPVTFVRFPDEGHELSRSGQPIHRLENQRRIVGWFQKYL